MLGRTLALVLLLGATAAAQEGYRHGRIRHVEGGVTLQRAAEPGAEEAFRNLPFLPGDRVWTDETGRSEFQFADASLVRLDNRSKLDYLAHEEGRRGDRVVLRLWSGAVYLRTGDAESLGEFEVETPAGVVDTRASGIYRIDVDAGETRLSVYEGEATLESGRRRVRVEEGERTYAARGEPPETPRRFPRSELDDFARWDRERERREAWAGDSRRYLPEEVDPYADEFDAHGSWYYEADIGYVWRPYVGSAWMPYLDGRWVWTPYGWTWVPYEPWGWAAFHYGRWGWSPALGWYWIPGDVWGPAWVSWAVGVDYVGWCPLGPGDRPVRLWRKHDRGHAVRRGTAPPPQSQTASDEGAAWIYARKADLTAPDLARRRVDLQPEQLGRLRAFESPRLRLTRELRPVEGEPSAPRIIRTKPTPGDTVPELRSDPATTIPLPIPKRRPAPETDERRERELRFRPEERRRSEEPRFERQERATPEAPRPAWPTREEAPRREGARPADPDPGREILRHFFKPLSERPAGSAPRAEPRSSEPRHVAPTPPRSEPKAAPQPAQERAVKRKEKEQ